MRCVNALYAGILLTTLVPARAGAQVTAPPLSAIDTHDNLHSAGVLRNGELRLSLWAGMGRWAPKGPEVPPLTVAALGEEGRALSIPSPLIRVPVGTLVHASIRNTLASPLRVSGLCPRPGRCDPLVIAPGETGAASFSVHSAGTFHYWAVIGPARLAGRAGVDSQLGGAIVADTAGARSDRIFVLGRTAGDAATAEATHVINGRSWPLTERLRYATGETANWRVVNLSNIAHAMHLHGFYFRVHGVGDGMSETPYEPAARRQAVTEQIPSGGIATMSWVPERAGNWLFHCHMLAHMMSPASLHGRPGASHELPAAAGMAGLVLGIHVTGAPITADTLGTPRRELQMVIDHDTRLGDAPSYKVSVTGNGQPAPRLNDRAAPGPIMFLTRGEPVAVAVQNRLREPTAIHWHGIELESYDDGVPGFGGTAGRVTPAVAPGGAFTARFTPSRAGTFIYHTHWHDGGQLAGGIYGPLIVLEPGEVYQPARDHIIVVGLEGAYPDDAFANEPFAINGERRPRELVLQAGVTNRLRFINITADTVAMTVQLSARFDPLQWTMVAKDGADTPPAQRVVRPARQLISVGETYDFEVTPVTGQGALWLELRRGNGEQLLQWPVLVANR